MCEADKAEVKAFSGNTPLEAILRSVELSYSATVAYYDDTPVAIFGVATSDYEGTQGSPWLLSTGKFDDFRISFLKISKGIIKDFLAPFERLVVTVHAANTKSLVWLKSNDFEIVNSLDFSGEKFYVMVLENTEVEA